MTGIDLAKNRFRFHGAAADGPAVFRRKPARRKVMDFLASQPKCVVVMEACAGARWRGRGIMELGHEVRLVPPVFVKPFVKRSRNDAADADGERAARLPRRVRRHGA